jgi:hypothetical protein
LTQFLRASDKVRYEWKLAKDHRSHIHRIIDAYDLLVTHTTRRTGSPFTLVLAKTAAIFERDATERREHAPIGLRVETVKVLVVFGAIRLDRRCHGDCLNGEIDFLTVLA